MAEEYNNKNNHEHHDNIQGGEEEFGNELGGARALLQLGNKNQPNDVDVEAAVMKLVGNMDSHQTSNGNNSGNSSSSISNSAINSLLSNGNGLNQNNRKRKLQFADEITSLNEFQQWTGFLEEELNASTQSSSHHHDQNNSSNVNDHLASDDDGSVPFLNTDDMSSSTTPKRSKKSRKKMESLSVDPELSNLDGSMPPTDHEQLVHAAIMNARELENEFGPINVQAVSDYFKENQQHQSQSQQHQQQHQQSQQQHQDKNHEDQQLQEQAAQAVVAAAAAAASARPVKTEKDETQNRRKKNVKKNKELTSNENAQIVADVVNKAHPWLTSTEREGSNDQNSTEVIPNQSNELETVGGKKSKKQRQSISQPSSIQQGKTFSKEETEAIDNYILAFCQINNMTREQMCQRIWSNKRQKDHFWESLQKVLPQRTRASLYKHVRRSYHIFQVRGKWSPEDDLELGRLALENPGNWKLIGGIMGRMPEDCRDRFRNYVKCGNNRSSSKWSEEEETILRAIVNSMLSTLEKENEPLIINWTLVSEQMNGKRSRIQCRYKWNKLMKTHEKRMSQYVNADEEIFRHDVSPVSPFEKERQLWVLGQLRSIYAHESEIEWDIMYTIYPYNKDQPQSSQETNDEYDIINGQSLKIYYEMIKLKYFNYNYKLEQNGRSLVDELETLMKKINEVTP